MIGNVMRVVATHWKQKFFRKKQRNLFKPIIIRSVVKADEVVPFNAIKIKLIM